MENDDWRGLGEADGIPGDAPYSGMPSRMRLAKVGPRHSVRPGFFRLVEYGRVKRYLPSLGDGSPRAGHIIYWKTTRS